MAKVQLPKWCSIVRSNPAAYERNVFAMPQVTTPQHAADLVRPRLSRGAVESFIVVSLDTQRRPLALTEATKGIVNSSLVHPREAFRVAIVMGASSVILAHNHPSGDPMPSPDDLTITTQLVSAGRIIDIPVLDHIIIGAGDRFTSLAMLGHI